MLKIIDAKDFKFICYMEAPSVELRSLAFQPVDPQSALPLLRGALQALRCAASVGISHRALTPASVLVDGPGNRVVVTDWFSAFDPRLPTPPFDPNFKGDLHLLAQMWNDRGEYPSVVKWVLDAMSRMPSHMHTSSTIDALVHRLDGSRRTALHEPPLPLPHIRATDARHCILQLLRDRSDQAASQVHPRLGAHFAASCRRRAYE
jgi:hypothetical protein